MVKKQKQILFFSEIRKKDIALVGGKNAALGEMFNTLTHQGISIPNGFAVTAEAYFYFVKNRKREVGRILSGLDASKTADLQKRGAEVRQLILDTPYPADLEEKIRESYRKLLQYYPHEKISCAVRSSATAEDLPMASFAGQLESYLNISGEDELLLTIKKCFSSLFTDRAISYRQDQKFPLWKVGISVGVQKMVRSDKACSGVIFTLDTESGFPDVVMITGGWGLGENIVKGRIEPDEYFVYKKKLLEGYEPIIKKHLGRKEKTMIYRRGKGNATVNLATPEEQRRLYILNDKEILKLADWAMKIEKYFGRPMDIEWAKDGVTDKLYIVQARPETVQSRRDPFLLEEYTMFSHGKALFTGISVGSRIGSGTAQVITSEKELSRFKQGNVLVARATDPSWEPVMKKAGAIITDTGGRTCHAAIVSRELGVPCLVGTGNATKLLANGQKITIDTSRGSEGVVYAGITKVKKKMVDLRRIKLPKKVEIKLNIGSPENAFANSFIPNNGVGLAREEFIISNYIGIHPLALINFAELPEHLKNKIKALTANYEDKTDFYIDKLAEGIGQIAAAFYPKEVVVRFSDFKTNEYRGLLGGELYEPKEDNPMLGWRGASRYYHPDFKEAFVLELKAIRKVIDKFGLDNVSTMIPFCRTAEEAKKVLEIMATHHLKRSSKFKVYLMCELPVNVLCAEQFLPLVDGYSIGSNDLTQLTMGVDRDSSLVAGLYDDQHPAVTQSLKYVIDVCKLMKKHISICGQAPSDFPEFAKFLVEAGIDALSLNPDAVIGTLSKLK